MERASETLQRIVADALHRLPTEQLPAAAWEFAAGNAVAERTRVIGCEDGALAIEVPDANWRAQLQAMSIEFSRGSIASRASSALSFESLAPHRQHPRPQTKGVILSEAKDPYPRSQRRARKTARQKGVILSEAKSLP